MTDAGAGPSVADALLGGDPRAAEAAVLDWAAALAAVHTGTLGSRAVFAAEVGHRAGDFPVAIDPMAGSWRTPLPSWHLVRPGPASGCRPGWPRS
jgi:hypothetical protein